MDHELSILPFSVCILVVLAIGLLLRYLRQPYVVAYILAGVVLGPFGLSVVSDKTFLVQLGSIGVLFLLFFVGMELSLPNLIKSWKVAVIGTLLQILISVLLVWCLGMFLGWPAIRSVALGFVISLSSTAVVIKLLQERSILDSQLGSNVLGVLLVQDLCLVPMLVTLSFMSGEAFHLSTFILQVVCGVGILTLMLWVFVKQEIHIPLFRFVKKDHEIEVFAALMLCFGLAVITEFCHMSAALGAFTAGIIVSAAKETTWVQRSLEPFHIVFVGLFFISVGMLIDLNFLVQHPFKIATLVFVVFLSNTFINASIFKALGNDWSLSIQAGSMLSQVGELSFLVAALGYRTAILGEFAYQTTISVIALTLLLSPAWIYVTETLVKKRCQ